MSVVIVKSNATVPTIPNDDYDVLVSSNNYLFSVYQNTPFSVDLTFSLFEGTEEMPIAVPITSVNSTFTTYNSVTFTIANTDPYAYKITVSGNLTDVVSGETYRILLNGGEIVNSSPLSLPSYLAVVGWNLPTSFSPPVTINNYSFVVTGSTITENVAMSQYVYWNFNTGVVDFRQAIAGGI
jgi:hypothetical protein